MSSDSDPFDWFLDELDEIRTQRFHVVERRPTSSELHATQGESYARFRRAFGTCGLYRTGSVSKLVVVHEPERGDLCELIDPGGELLQIAISTGGRLFLARSDL